MRIISRVYSSRWFVGACRVLLAGVFVYAAIGKIARPGEFADAVAAFRILPVYAVNIFAIILPWVEMLSGLALLSKVTARHGALVLLALNLIFLAAIGSAMARGLDIGCGCFTASTAHSAVGWGLITRDLGLMLLCLPVAAGSKR